LIDLLDEKFIFLIYKKDNLWISKQSKKEWIIKGDKTNIRIEEEDDNLYVLR